MWLLKDDNNEKCIYLKPNATMTVGRNKGDIVLSGDGSISRVHAQITVKTAPDFDKITEKTQPLSNCTFKDPGSKYGNFILKDGTDIPISKEGYELRHMDRIRFGLQNYIFTVHYIPIITVTSGMTDKEKEQLKDVIDAIDGKIIYAWSPLCTHMTIVKPTISEKLSCALASQTPIVSMDYWDSVTKAFKENHELPDPIPFASSIDNKMQEIGKISVRPNIARKTLFENLTFVHFNSKQFALYSRMIKLAGGKSLQYGNHRTNPDVCDDNVIVVQLIESNTTQATGTGDAVYANVCEKLNTCRRRTIPESEIALALLHCSTAQYCNPKFDYATLLETRRDQSKPKDMTVLALDTQDVELPSTSNSSQQVNKVNTAAIHCIPESVEKLYDAESQPERKYHKNASNESVKIVEINSYRNKVAGPSESVKRSITDDLPSESEIGSMKVASLNHENYLQEQFNKRVPINEITMKRDRDKEDDRFDERKKKMCLGESLIDKAIKREKNGPSKSDQSYADMMPDDEDEFFIDEQIVEKVLEHKEERRNFARSLSAEKELERMSERRRPIEKRVDDAVLKSTTVSTSSRISKDRSREFETGERKPMENSATEHDEKLHKRKIGRSDISPPSDITENPRKRNKIEVANDRHIDGQTMKAALMDFPSSLSKLKKKNLVNKIDDRTSTTLDFHGSKKDSSTVSGKWIRASTTHNYDTTNFFKLPNDPNSKVVPLLRIDPATYVYDKNNLIFGKTFRKQKVTIPVRVKLETRPN